MILTHPELAVIAIQDNTSFTHLQEKNINKSFASELDTPKVKVMQVSQSHHTLVAVKEDPASYAHE